MIHVAVSSIGAPGRVPEHSFCYEVDMFGCAEPAQADMDWALNLLRISVSIVVPTTPSLLAMDNLTIPYHIML